jgi:HEAT repeat protein
VSGAARAALASNDPSVRAAACAALGDARVQGAAGDVAALLGDEDARVRLSAAYALGEIGAAAWVAAVARLADDRDPRVRAEAALALGKLGDRAALPALRSLLGDVFPVARREAAIALGALGDPAAAADLAHHLDDEDAEVRREAALALAVLRDARGFDVLHAALDDAATRSEAIDALATLGDARALPRLAALSRSVWTGRLVRLQAAAARVRLGDVAAVPFVIERITSRKADERAYAMWLAGELALRDAVPALAVALARRGDPHRDAAARALGRCGDARALPALLAVLDEVPEADAELRVDVCESLGLLGTAAATPRLRALAADERNDAAVRAAARAALARIAKE